MAKNIAIISSSFSLCLCCCQKFNFSTVRRFVIRLVHIISIILFLHRQHILGTDCGSAETTYCVGTVSLSVSLSVCLFHAGDYVKNAAV